MRQDFCTKNGIRDGIGECSMNYSDAIPVISRQIAEQFNPEKIVLFGSYAYGTPSDESDVDLLVILPFEGKSAHKSVEIIRAIKPCIPLDVIVRTREQIAERLCQNDFFLREIMEKGKVLYEAAYA